MTAEDLMQLGPLAVVAIVLAREVLGAWKWREERRGRSEAERHAARVQLQTIRAASQRAYDDADDVFRNLYEQLLGRVESTSEDRFERLASVASRSAEALEQATAVIEMALERLGDQDG